MSAALKLAPQEEIQVGGSPKQRPVARPVVKKKRNLGAVVALTSVWALFMALSLTLVQKNLAIRAENTAMARMQEEITKLEQRNLELQNKVDSAVSIDSVQQWATRNQMVAPTGAIAALQGKPEAVAVRQAPEPASVQAQVAQAQPSFWQALLARLTGSGGQSASAAAH